MDAARCRHRQNRSVYERVRGLPARLPRPAGGALLRPPVGDAVLSLAFSLAVILFAVTGGDGNWGDGSDSGRFPFPQLPMPEEIG